MKAEDLLTALNDLDPDILMDAQQASAPRRPRRGRKLMTLVPAAVIASTMVLTAFASSDGSLWFRGFFSRNSQQPLSQDQNAYIATHTVQNTQSQTVNGYTITLNSAISDGKRTFLHCTLTAPEGTVLDADHYGDIHGTVFEFQEPGNSTFMGGYGWTNQDSDPADNIATLLFSYEASYTGLEDTSFTDNPCRLLIYGLQATYYEGEGMDMTQHVETLTEGMWSFDIQFPEDSGREIEFITGYTECPCEIQLGLEKTGENTLMPILESTNVQITSLTLRSLSADFHFKYAQRDQINADFDEMYIVMKDGTKIAMQQSSGAPNYIGFEFETPIILDNVDHILLPGSNKLPVPQ